jgi:hypothetical protein
MVDAILNMAPRPPTATEQLSRTRFFITYLYSFATLLVVTFIVVVVVLAKMYTFEPDDLAKLAKAFLANATTDYNRRVPEFAAATQSSL